MSNSKEITKLAIKRHDIDADDFQERYSKKDRKDLSPREVVFLQGREWVLKELNNVLIAFPKGSKVLDVGCGTAHLTKWIQDKGFEVYGVEPSEEMLKHAMKNFPDIEFKKAISSQVPYPDNSFDIIVSFEVLRYCLLYTSPSPRD